MLKPHCAACDVFPLKIIFSLQNVQKRQASVSIRIIRTTSNAAFFRRWLHELWSTTEHVNNSCFSCKTSGKPLPWRGFCVKADGLQLGDAEWLKIQSLI
ncbi:hypothetical protein T10_3455 [Trichinella papuae]|uniref:Uncharacterized protein n=1 Tax=Trichinella papuae TaxID=268474 RepID=A0A0V1MTL4_9BILA|nr:hypothetical protein T10_3455 [Trichinella papuae]